MYTFMYLCVCIILLLSIITMLSSRTVEPGSFIPLIINKSTTLQCSLHFTVFCTGTQHSSIPFSNFMTVFFF